MFLVRPVGTQLQSLFDMNIQSCKIWSLKNTLSLKCLLGYLSVDNVHSTKIKSLMFTISEIYFLHCAF